MLQVVVIRPQKPSDKDILFVASAMHLVSEDWVLEPQQLFFLGGSLDFSIQIYDEKAEGKKRDLSPQIRMQFE